MKKLLILLLLIAFPVQAEELFCRPVLVDSCWTTNAEHDKEEWLNSLPKTVNFDEAFIFRYCAYDEDCQPLVDKDYVVQMFEDYYHHNTNKFMDLFNSIKEGDKVIVGGKEYTADFRENAHIVEYIYMIGNTTGRDSYMDGTVELVTCADPYVSPNRILWHLK